MQVLVIFSRNDANSLLFEDGTFYLWNQLVQAHPDHQFIFLIPNQSPGNTNFSDKVSVLSYAPTKWKWLQRIRLSKWLTKITFDQAILMNELPNLDIQAPVTRWVLQSIPQLPASWFMERTTRFLFTEKLTDVKNRIFISNQLVHAVVHPFSQLGFVTKHQQNIELFKSTHTSGHDFVLYNLMGTADSEMCISRLKAYTQFKHWNKTGLQLMLMVRPKERNKIEHLLHNYKLRSEVHVLVIDDADLLDRAVQASFMTLDFTPTNFLTATMFCALQYQIPLAVADTDYFRSIFADTVLYVKSEEGSLASVMNHIYKDEAACVERFDLFSKKGKEEKENWQALKLPLLPS